MYGDTTAIRHLAGTMSDQADEIRTCSAQLLREARSVPWEGVAADAMRGATAHTVTEMRDTARLHDEAAAALRHHADLVDARKALTASIERHVLDLVDGALGRLGRLVDAVTSNPVDEMLARFVPPPSGSISWLDLDLPGVDLPQLDLPHLDLPHVDLPHLPFGVAA